MAPVPKPKRERQRHFIAQWRKHLGLTQDQVAERIDMSRENYSKIERGLVPYNQDFLEAVADALGRSPADLIMRDPNSIAWSIYDTLEKLPEKTRKQALAVIDALKEAS